MGGYTFPFFSLKLSEVKRQLYKYYNTIIKMKLTKQQAEELKESLISKFKQGGDFQTKALTEMSPWSRSKLPDQLKLQHLECGGKMGKKKKIKLKK